MDDGLISLDCSYPVRSLHWCTSTDTSDDHYLVTASLHFTNKNKLQVRFVCGDNIQVAQSEPAGENRFNSFLKGDSAASIADPCVKAKRGLTNGVHHFLLYGNTGDENSVGYA